ncbi:MAG: hypothetical protein ABIR62_03585 [Dokdonella sp.]|uniref:hypothetical protein n=1 Tax=Dokdonella sp. TaxID=2291710 RepID=UPI0032646419
MRMHRSRSVAALLAIVAITGCGKKVDLDAPLAFAPADTPYVIANLEPLPQAAVARMADQMQASWSLALPMVDKLIDGALAKNASDDTAAGQIDAKSARVAKAILAEIRTRDTPEKWQQVGLGPNVRSAIYGVGILPVMRVELADVDAFRAMVARVEQNAGDKLATARVGEQDVWTIGDAHAQVLIAIEGKHLVATVVPGTADEAMKRRALGLDRPASSLAETDAVGVFNKARGYLPYGSGWIDTRRVLALVNDDPAIAAFAEKAGMPKTALDATCRSELDAIAAKMPRFGFGYTAFDADKMAVHARLDLDPALAKSLAALPGALPGARSPNALFDLAFALPILRGRDFLVAQADAIAAAPYKCALLADLNEAATESKAKLDQTIPPPIADLSGARATLDSLVLPDAATSKELEFSGRILIGSSNPSFLTGLAQMAVPGLQKITLAPDGKAVAIPSDALPGDIGGKFELYVAMTPTVLGISVGKDQAAKLEAAVAAKPASAGTLLETNVSGAIYTLAADGMQQYADKLPPDPDMREMLESQRKMYALYAQWFRQIDFNVAFGADGIDFQETVDFAKH